MTPADQESLFMGVVFSAGSIVAVILFVFAAWVVFVIVADQMRRRRMNRRVKGGNR